MRRNVSSELIVALLAAVSLLFAAVFAVLLSTSTSQRPPGPPTVATVEVATSTVTALAVGPVNVTETPVPEDVTHVPVESETPMHQPIAATDTTPAVVATTEQTVVRTSTTAVATELPLATQTSARQTEIGFPPATTTPAAIASATPSPTDILPTATLEEAETPIAPANLTLTAIRETVVVLVARSTERAEATVEPTAVDMTETPLATEAATETPKPSPTDSLPTAMLEEVETHIAPANLTLTSIRETVVALVARSTARIHATADLPAVVATETPLATEAAAAVATEIPKPTATDSLPTATLEEAATPIAPANLTLTAIRETVVALMARSTARAEATIEPPAVDATETPQETESTTADATVISEPSPTEVTPIATLEEAATRIAPANLTLTAIRETVVVLSERSTSRAEATLETKPVDAIETPLARETAEADATEVTPTATLEEAATRIAPANLTLTATRETVVALAERSTARAEATAEPTAADATETPHAMETAAAVATDIPAPSPTDSLPTAMLEEAATRIAPANLTLTAIRETVVALAARSTARADATAEPTDVESTESPFARETVAADATEVTPIATLEEAVAGIAPANLTLTAIRETVVALMARSAARADATAGPTVVDATERPLATETAAADATEIPVPSPTDSLPTATLEEAATRIAPANLTLTAIRGTVVALAERSTATADLTAVVATKTPHAMETAAAVATDIPEPSATDSLPTATLEEAAKPIAPANLTLTAIRETVAALVARAEATAEPTAADATETTVATETAAADATVISEPSPTDSLPTVTLEEVATRIAPANLTLTAIRETVVALAVQSTERALLTAEVTPGAATETTIATETVTPDGTETPMPSPTDVRPTAATEKAETGITPANLTLTAIRETVVVLSEQSTARAEATLESKPVDAIETPLARETAAADATETPKPSPTDSLPTATLEEAATRIAPANLTLTAIRETVVALAERSTARAEATTEPTAIDATETPELSPTDSLALATLEEAELRIAPVNLTLTAIRETVVALAARSTAWAEATAEPTAIDATETTVATETAEAVVTEIQVASPTDSLALATLEETESRIAPANLTLTAIRETVVVLAGHSTARAEATAEPTAADATETPLARGTMPAEATELLEPSPTDSLPTATLEEAATRIAPANLTLTAIRETVVALAVQSTERALLTAEVTPGAATETTIATETAAALATETPAPSTTDVPPTTTPEEVATRIAPANLTLTAIRETVDVLAARSTARVHATADLTAVVATETPHAMETAAAVATDIPEPSATDSLPTAMLEEVETRIAPANLTLTAIRETVDVLAARSTARAEATAEPTAADATETPLARGTMPAEATELLEPSPTDSLPTATLEEAATRIAPANLTLTAIRETVVALAARSTARAEATAEPTAIDATETPAPSATEVTPIATVEEVATPIAPANLTLTAIRETVVALAARSAARAEATAEPTAIDATETPEPSPTEVTPTATLEEAVTVIAPANLTLTAIRETAVVLGERSTARAEAAQELTAVEVTDSPLPTVAVPTVSTEIATSISTDWAIADTARPVPQIPAAMTASATLRPSDTASPTAARAPTVTPLPFHFAQLIPTPTDVESVASRELPECEVQQGWQNYEVQAGDTLLSLALATGSSLIELRDGNCFEPIRGIFAGQRLLVPRLPADRIERPEPVYPRVDEAADLRGCDQPTARISAPEPLASLKGVFALRGTVQLPQWGGYQIALRPAWADNYYLYLNSNKPIRGDVITLINTEIFGPGLHRIRLKVTSRDGGAIEGGLCDVPVVFVAP